MGSASSPGLLQGPEAARNLEEGPHVFKVRTRTLIPSQAEAVLQGIERSLAPGCLLLELEPQEFRNANGSSLPGTLLCLCTKPPACTWRCSCLRAQPQAEESHQEER